MAACTHLVSIALQPLADALQVKGMATSPPYDRAVISGELGARRAAVEWHATDATHIVARIPRPRSRRVPVPHGDLERHSRGLDTHSGARSSLTSAAARPKRATVPGAESPRLPPIPAPICVAALAPVSCPYPCVARLAAAPRPCPPSAKSTTAVSKFPSKQFAIHHSDSLFVAQTTESHSGTCPDTLVGRRPGLDAGSARINKSK